MYLTLEWSLNGQKRQQTFRMNHIIDLGRLSSSHIYLQDKTVSRRHAILYPYKQGIYLQNMSQTNKIWIDHCYPLQKGESILLQENVSFNIGRITFHVIEMSTKPNTFAKRWCIPQNKTLTATPRHAF